MLDNYYITILHFFHFRAKMRVHGYMQPCVTLRGVASSEAVSGFTSVAFTAHCYPRQRHNIMYVFHIQHRLQRCFAELMGPMLLAGHSLVRYPHQAMNLKREGNGEDTLANYTRI